MLGIELPATFSEFGGNMIQGLIDGITGMIPNVKEKISAVGESVSGWFKDVLGINSPSRVFSGHGGDVMAGLQQGLGNGEGGVMDRILGIGRNLVSKGKELAGRLMSALGFDSPTTQPALAGAGGIQFDNRPALQPLQTAAAGNSLSIGEIHVHAAPAWMPKPWPAWSRKRSSACSCSRPPAPVHSYEMRTDHADVTGPVCMGHQYPRLPAAAAADKLAMGGTEPRGPAPGPAVRGRR